MWPFKKKAAAVEEPAREKTEVEKQLELRKEAVQKQLTELQAKLMRDGLGLSKISIDRALLLSGIKELQFVIKQLDRRIKIEQEQGS